MNYSCSLQNDILQVWSNIAVVIETTPLNSALIILCPSESPSLKKGALCMECKVRYFLFDYMQLVLKYNLILFIICSRGCHANIPHFLSCS